MSVRVLFPFYSSPFVPNAHMRTFFKPKRNHTRLSPRSLQDSAAAHRGANRLQAGANAALWRDRRLLSNGLSPLGLETDAGRL